MHPRSLTVTTAGFLALMATIGVGRASANGLANSGHDFSINAAGEAATCVVCHAPSASEPSEANRSVSSGPGFATAGGDGHGSNSASSFAEGGANSRPCLGCHDGSVAPSNLLHTPGGRGGISSSLLGMDAVIGEGHPVFVVYDGLVASRKGLFDPDTTPSGLGGTIGDDLLVDSQIVCSSCHGVHDQSGRGDFLRISNERSRLCLTCHNL